ncbi:MAG: 4'-phosphopantetheinyl transferase superfamily protein [Acidobacteriia bacterium]|nr:4'-phosphopantetheinyl transferase superfamily protein [Terriglobia bacterium]
MTEVYWLEQADTDMPAENDWLSAGEMLRLNSMRVAKRRADWRLGRWTAKRAVSIYLDLPSHAPALADIEILPAPSGAPEVLLANHPAQVAISISHRAGVAVCAVGPSGVALGCDLEMIEPRSDAFVADYFTAEEQALVARASAAERSQLLALLWSGKESALKALAEGLRLDTRCVTVCPFEQGLGNDEDWWIDNPRRPLPSGYGLNRWRPLQARCTNGPVFHGWWQHTDSLLRTVVAAPPPVPPILLKNPADQSAMPLP